MNLLEKIGKAFSGSEEVASLVNDDFVKAAATILEGIGGIENISSVENCITRLRVEVKDASLVNEKVITSSGAKGVIRPTKTNVQIIVGEKVNELADAFRKLIKE